MNFFTSKLSDTFRFDAYPTFFHTLLALPQSIFNPSILEFWWFLQFFHLIITVVASYLVGYELSKNKWVGLISAIFGAFVFESFVAYTAYFLIPQNLAATITTFFIARTLHRYSAKAKLVDFITLAFIPYILLNHLIIGTFGLAILIFSILYINLAQKTENRLEKYIVVASFLLLLIIPVLASKIDISFINRGEAAHYNFSNTQKLSFMRDFYGYIFLILYPLGIFYLLRKNKTACNLIVIISIGVLSLVISPFPYSLKFYTIGRFFTHAIMGVGLWMLIRGIHPIYKVFCLILLTCVLSTVLISNLFSWKQTPVYRETSTHVSPSEIEAANFLKSNYGTKNVLLISDPATMFILEGLSGVNSQGGAYADDSTRRILSQVYYSRNSKTMASELFEIKDLVIKRPPDKLLLAISGRFTEWELASEEDKYGIQWNAWRPQDIALPDEEIIYFVKEYSKFKEVFKNNGIVIFEIERPL